MRNRLTRAAMRRARRLGWPNTYTFTKSLAESLLTTRGAGLPIAIVAAVDRGNIHRAAVPRME